MGLGRRSDYPDEEEAEASDDTLLCKRELSMSGVGVGGGGTRGERYHLICETENRKISLPLERRDVQSTRKSGGGDGSHQKKGRHKNSNIISGGGSGRSGRGDAHLPISIIEVHKQSDKATIRDALNREDRNSSGCAGAKVAHAGGADNSLWPHRLRRDSPPSEGRFVFDNDIDSLCREEERDTDDSPSSSNERGCMYEDCSSCEDLVREAERRVEEGGYQRHKPHMPTLILSDEHYDYKIWNGQSLRVSTLHECLSCGGSFWNKEDMPHELAYLQISESDYHAACEHLRACTKIRQYSLCYNHWLHSAVFLLVFLASWCAAFGIWTSQGLSARVGAGVVVLAAVAVTAICSCVCGCVRRRLNSRTRRCLAKVNEIFSRYKLLAGLVEEGALTCYRLSMHFIYFDLGPCMEKMTEDLNKLVTRKKSKHDKPHVIVSSDDMGVLEDTDMVLLSGDITEKQRQDFARQLLFRYCDAFINDIVANRIRKIPPGRHSRDGACLCQYVQQRFFNLKNEDLK